MSDFIFIIFQNLALVTLALKCGRDYSLLHLATWRKPPVRDGWIPVTHCHTFLDPSPLKCDIPYGRPL